MTDQPKCLHCGVTDQTAPLINLTYQGQPLWICSTHLPILIHHPEQLVQQLEEAVRKQD